MNNSVIGLSEVGYFNISFKNRAIIINNKNNDPLISKLCLTLLVREKGSMALHSQRYLFFLLNKLTPIRFQLLTSALSKKPMANFMFTVQDFSNNPNKFIVYIIFKYLWLHSHMLSDFIYSKESIV